VLIFQDGNLEGLLGFHSEGALDATQPILLFAVGFGLATDYGVLLLSRIQEAHDGGASNSEAVAIGLERTGRLVTSAAILFAVAIGAFAVSEIVFIKELGVGAALAVLIDASIIRALLVPFADGAVGLALTGGRRRPCDGCHERIGLQEEPAQTVAQAELDVAGWGRIAGAVERPAPRPPRHMSAIGQPRGGASEPGPSPQRWRPEVALTPAYPRAQRRRARPDT